MVKKEPSLFKEEKEQILLQNLAEKRKKEFEAEFEEYDFESFSEKKTLLDYQQEALKNAFSILNLYFNECEGDKDKFYPLLGVQNSLDIRLEKDSLLREYFQIPLSSKILEFKQIVNQMCFWMATGSGKTIVIIKLIELLNQAMDSNLIHRKDIFFFSANEDLLEAFKKEIEGYNENKKGCITCHSLKDYEARKRDRGSLFEKDFINIFIYPAYNLCEESKDKQLDFKTVLNNGDNYVILDEAHKGNKSYSKMQHIMNILSKNGFLFNFSATFTSSQDIAMTVLNLNLIEWIQKGYGKKPILLKGSDLSAFKQKEDFNENEKKKAILKALIALCLCKKRKIQNSYHDPMMLVFTNSVSAENSDAHIFFKIIQNIANNDDEGLFEEAKEEMARELKKENYLIQAEDNISFEFLSNTVLNLELNEIKKQVFHTSSGNLEALYYEKSADEILLKLDSVEKPFMLIRIGNIKEWIENHLKGIKISKSYKDLEAFKNIEESSINILLGSRKFSEGWNTTRPNVTLFLNIGVDKEAKTFVMQSLGRSVRIESFNKDRRRGHFIEKEANPLLESIFIFATTPSAVGTIIENTKLKNISQKSLIKLEKNPLANTKNLLIPKYKLEKKPPKEILEKSRIRASKQNIELAKIYANTSNAAIALKHGIKVLEKIKLVKELLNGSGFYSTRDKHYKSLDRLVNEVEKRAIVKVEVLDKFKRLKDEIRHFEKIYVNKIKKLQVEAEIKEILTDKRSGQSIATKAKYKYLEKHYYKPLICEEDSVDFSHIVKSESEINFLKKLDELSKEIDKSVKWWFFSKIEENIDDVYIPYIRDSKDRKFYPDFIFWIEKKDGSQKIAFVDPKGTQNTDYEFKCDGFDDVFKNNYNDKNIEVKLYLIKDSSKKSKEVSKGYAGYWLDLTKTGKGGLMEIFW